MRVVCNTLDEFLENLSKERPSSVVQSSVYVNRTRQPMGEDKRNAVQFQVVFQASAVVDISEGQYLLQMGMDCGMDYEDATQEKDGTKKQAKLYEKLNEFCKLRGLTVRPGVVDF